MRTKLHLGAFNSPVEGWVNTDITPHIWISRVPFFADIIHRLGKMTDERLEEHRHGIFRKLTYLNLYKSFPYDDNTFTSVFSSHVFEHLFPSRVPRVLHEIHRVLKPGGVVRIVVPSLEKYIKEYTPENPEKMLSAVFEHQAGVKNRHQWMYTEQSLVRLLLENGFKDAKACLYREGECEDLEQIDNRPENSIYVEAKK